MLAGLFCAAGAVAAVADYTRVVAVYDAQSETPLQERLRVGLRSAFFSHQAAYAAATVSREPAQEMDALRQAAHNLLDTRLMIAWAKAYADSGDLPRAQYLVARLREFRNPAAADFFEPCDAPAPQVASAAAPAAAGAQAAVSVPATRPTRDAGLVPLSLNGPLRLPQHRANTSCTSLDLAQCRLSNKRAGAAAALSALGPRRKACARA